MSRENNTPNFPSFFRTEVIASKNQLSLGTIRIAQSASSMFVSCIALALAGTLIAYVYFGSITKKAHISGIIVPSGGSISIVAPSAGIVSQKLVIDGQNILKGQALFEIS